MSDKPDKSLSMKKGWFARFFFRKRIILILLLFLGAVGLYHNDAAYTLFRDKINPAIQSITGIDLLGKTNSFAQAINFSSTVKSWTTKLEESDFIDIEIDEDQQDILDSLLTKRPVRKKWVDIRVKINGEYQAARLKFHGTSEMHYQDNKYSYTIKVSNESDYFDNVRRFKLMKGEEADPTIIAVNQVANSLDLIAPTGRLVILRINDKEVGHYGFFEDIKKSFLEREFGITSYSVLNNVSDWTRKENPALGSNHISDFDLDIEHLERDNKPQFEKAAQQYKALTDAIKAGDLKTYRTFFDAEYMGKFMALASVFNDVHFMTGDNVKLIYDFHRAKFFPLYRGETGGRQLYTHVMSQDDIFVNSFPNYNRILFRSIPPYQKSVNAALFKMALMDDEIRYHRDKQLFSFTKEPKKFLETIKGVVNSNEPILKYSKKASRDYQLTKKEQINIVNTMLSLGKKYLGYGHIYGTFDRQTGVIDLQPDAFCPINVSGPFEGLPLNSLHGIYPNIQFENQYQSFTIPINRDSLKVKELTFVNAVTGDTISKRHIHINKTNSAYASINTPDATSLDKNNIRYTQDDRRLIIEKGIYSVTTSIDIPASYSLTIPAGVTLQLADSVNIVVRGNVSIAGNETEKVNIIKTKNAESFGCFIVLGEGVDTTVEIDHLYVDGGGSTYTSGREFTGQFAIYNATATITNSTFANSSGDDGLNVKFGKVLLENCRFVDNKADQVDLDFCFAKVDNCEFAPSLLDNNGDGLDLSGSYALITNCYYSQFLDKGLSLGENSRAIVHSCHFEDNNNAIAIKDQTKMYAWNNTFVDNQNDYTSYIKKKIFNVPQLYLDVSHKSLQQDIQVGEIWEVNATDFDSEEKRFEDAYAEYKLLSGLAHTKKLHGLVNNN